MLGVRQSGRQCRGKKPGRGAAVERFGSGVCSCRKKRQCFEAAMAVQFAAVRRDFLPRQTQAVTGVLRCGRHYPAGKGGNARLGRGRLRRQRPVELQFGLRAAGELLDQ